MLVKSIKTHKITKADTDLLKILDKYVEILNEGSVVVVASKIVAITQGRVVKASLEEKDELVKKEADYYIDKALHRSNLYITLKNDVVTFSSGIDESNNEEGLVLWPKNVQVAANEVRAFLKQKFGLKEVGVIITDMTVLPLRWGVIAGAIGYSGFNPLKDLRGKPDIFGQEFKFTKVGILNGLAAAAGVVMGEGSEQTPIAVIEDLPFVEFADKDPSKEELESLITNPEDDMYGPLFKNAPWQKGGSSV